jgi:hypothetical protein
MTDFDAFVQSANQIILQTWLRVREGFRSHWVHSVSFLANWELLIIQVPFQHIFPKWGVTIFCEKQTFDRSRSTFRHYLDFFKDLSPLFKSSLNRGDWSLSPVSCYQCCRGPSSRTATSARYARTFGSCRLSNSGPVSKTVQEVLQEFPVFLSRKLFARNSWSEIRIPDIHQRPGA